MYFASRAQAGRTLAARLIDKYRYENCVVLAVNDGGVVVGAQIAAQLHCAVGMLLLSEINLPRETSSIGSINSGGGFTYNSAFSSGDIDELQSEYRGYIEEQKITKLHEMHEQLGFGGLMRRDLLVGHNVIVVSDGLLGGSALAAVQQYLKPVNIDRMIIATPFVDLQALDIIHIIADEIHCLNVIDGTFDIDHYFEDPFIPDHQTIVKTVEDIVLHWK